MSTYTAAGDGALQTARSPQKRILPVGERSNSRNSDSNNIAVTPLRESFLVHYRKLTGVHAKLLGSLPVGDSNVFGGEAPRPHERMGQISFASSDSSVSSTDTQTHSIATTTSSKSKPDCKITHHSGYYHITATSGEQHYSSLVQTSPPPSLSAPTPSSNAKQLLMGFLQGPPTMVETATIPLSGSSSNNGNREASPHSNETIAKKPEELIYPKKATTPSRYTAHTTTVVESLTDTSDLHEANNKKKKKKIALKCYSLDAEGGTDVDTSLQDLEEKFDGEEDTVVVDRLVMEKYQKSSSTAHHHPHSHAGVVATNSNNISCITSRVEGPRSLEQVYLRSNSTRSDPMKSLIKSFLLSNPGSSSDINSIRQQQQSQPEQLTLNVYSSSTAAPPSQSNRTSHQNHIQLHPLPLHPRQHSGNASSSGSGGNHQNVFDKLLTNSKGSHNITAILREKNAEINNSFAETITTTATATVAHANINRENITFPARAPSAKVSTSYLRAPFTDDVSIATAHFQSHSDHAIQQQREVAGNYSKQPENFSSMSPNSFQGAILRMRAENNRIRTDIQRFKGTVEVRLYYHTQNTRSKKFHHSYFIFGLFYTQPHSNSNNK